MPLHLLGKKSWNVYNSENVARVQRDEAAAAAAEEAAEQRMQEVDATRRLAILRGEIPPPLPSPEPEIRSDRPIRKRDDTDSGRERSTRKRKRVGEDDTDFEIRLARGRAEMGSRVSHELAKAPVDGQASKQKERDIVDKQGHIDLFGAAPDISARAKMDKNPEFEREAARKKREMEDQYMMRFSNAAGRDGFSAGAPWYTIADGRAKAGAATTKEDLVAEIGLEAFTKDAWGREDPKRKVREVARLDANDPLAMMRRGAKQVREVNKERQKEAEVRERELKELKREEKRRERRRRKDRSYSRGAIDTTPRSQHRERAERRYDDKRREDRHRRHRDDDDDGHRDRDKARDRSSRPHWRDDDRHRHREQASP